MTPGIITELTFTRMPRSVEHLQTLQLALDQDARGFDARDALVLPEDPGIDLRAHIGIDQLMVMVTWSML